MCRKQKVEIDLQIMVPAHTEQMVGTELCVIFGNLLENALEACGRMTEGKAFIHMKSRLEHGLLIISMDNSFNGQSEQHNGRFLSSKREGIGIGLYSIQPVAKAHQGDARFEAEGAVFHSLVYCRL